MNKTFCHFFLKFKQKSHVKIGSVKNATCPKAIQNKKHFKLKIKLMHYQFVSKPHIMHASITNNVKNYVIISINISYLTNFLKYQLKKIYKQFYYVFLIMPNFFSVQYFLLLST